jgi:hypothetical protein
MPIIRQESLLLQEISEGFVSDEMIAIDATHIEARDRALSKSDKVKKEPQTPLVAHFLLMFHIPSKQKLPPSG